MRKEIENKETGKHAVVSLTPSRIPRVSLFQKDANDLPLATRHSYPGRTFEEVVKLTETFVNAVE